VFSPLCCVKIVVVVVAVDVSMASFMQRLWLSYACCISLCLSPGVVLLREVDWVLFSQFVDAIVSERCFSILEYERWFGWRLVVDFAIQQNLLMAAAIATVHTSYN